MAMTLSAAVYFTLLLMMGTSATEARETTASLQAAAVKPMATMAMTALEETSIQNLQYWAACSMAEQEMIFYRED